MVKFWRFFNKVHLTLYSFGYEINEIMVISNDKWLLLTGSFLENEEKY